LALTRSSGDVVSGVRWYGSVLMSTVTVASAFIQERAGHPH
jgi:hypothetical protein